MLFCLEEHQEGNIGGTVLKKLSATWVASIVLHLYPKGTGQNNQFVQKPPEMTNVVSDSLC